MSNDSALFSESGMIRMKYEWNDISITVTSNNASFFDEIGEYFEFIPCESDFVRNIRIDFRETDRVEIERQYELLSRGVESIKSIPFELDDEVTLFSFRRESIHVNYFKDYSLVIVDYEKNSVKIFRPYGFSRFILWHMQLCLASPFLRIAEKFGYAKIHAACFENFGRAVLILGKSGAGKSTCAFNLALGGVRVISDEWTVVRRDSLGYSAHSVLNYMKIDTDALNNLFGSSGSAVKFCEFRGNSYFKKTGFGIPEMNSSDFTVAAMLFICGGHGEESHFSGSNASDIVWRLFPVTMYSEMPKEIMKHKFDLLTDLVSDENITVKNLMAGNDMEGLKRKLLEKMW